MSRWGQGSSFPDRGRNCTKALRWEEGPTLSVKQAGVGDGLWPLLW